jgi:hypothetical protein
MLAAGAQLAGQGAGIHPVSVCLNNYLIDIIILHIPASSLLAG